MSPEVVLITGCSTGIGRATAERLARAGHTVYATARREASIDDLRAAGCRTLALDVTQEESMRAAVDAVVAAEGRVGALVNNAGYSQSGAIETVDMDDLRRQFETNVFGLIRMCQLVPALDARAPPRADREHQLRRGEPDVPGGGVYHATKYAVEAISDALRFEVKGFGVDVAVIQPGLIRTEFANTVAREIKHEEGPYATFNANVAASTQGAYEGPLKVLGGGPEVVAKAIEKAITARTPKIRTRVTPSAHLLVGQRRLLPDRLWDRFLETQSTHPKPD